MQRANFTVLLAMCTISVGIGCRPQPETPEGYRAEWRKNGYRKAHGWKTYHEWSYYPLHPSTDDFHAYHIKHFTETKSFGGDRLIRMHYAGETDFNPVITEKAYQLNDLSLISLEEPPLKTLRRGGPGFGHLHSVARIYGNNRESELIDFFQENPEQQTTISTDTNEQKVIYGAVRAQKSCLKCHEGTLGDVFAMFRYDLQPASNKL